MYEWLCANKLKLNIQKTKYMVFNSNRLPETNITINLDGNQISRVGNSNEAEKTIRFLGVKHDETLTWKPQLEQIKSKLSCSIFALNKVKNILPHSALNTLYYCLVHSNLWPTWMG